MARYSYFKCGEQKLTLVVFLLPCSLRDMYPFLLIVFAITGVNVSHLRGMFLKKFRVLRPNFRKYFDFLVKSFVRLPNID